MAATIEFNAPSGLTLTLELYPYGSDTIANGSGGDSATEKTNNKSLYSATVAEVLVGRHNAIVKSGTTVIGSGHVLLVDGKTCRVRAESLEGGDYRNTTLSAFEFKLLSSSDHVTAVIGATVTSTRSIDGGAFAATTNAATEVGGGIYKIDLSAADRNGNVVTLRFAATGADTVEHEMVLNGP